MVIVFASQEDELAKVIKQVLKEQGAECVVLRPPGPSSTFGLTWKLPAPSSGYVQLDGRVIDQADITGILVRALPETPRMIHAGGDDDYLRMEWHAALLGWLQAVPAPVVNRPRPGRSIRPPYLAAYTALLSACGLRLADMIVSDSTDRAYRFLEQCSGKALLLPGGVGRAVPFAADSSLSEEVIGLVALPEGIIQRVHVVNGQAFINPIEGDTGGLDSSHSLGERCCAVARSLGFPFLELTVVSNQEADVVVNVADLPEACFEDPDNNHQIAAALARALTASREEVAV